MQPSILNAKNKYFICAKYFCNKVQLRVTMPKISKKKQSSSDSDSGPDDVGYTKLEIIYIKYS